MINEFKFLEGPSDYVFLPDDMASWIWDYEIPYIEFYDVRNHYELVTEVFTGIANFLEQFPTGYIAVVQKIVNPDTMITRDRNTRGEPWGFNIQTEQIEVTYYRFTEQIVI